MSVHNGYWLGGVEQLSQSTARADFPHSVEGGPVVPVATDGGGNAFLLGPSGRVWRWDHETDSLVEIADSFQSFLERVADDWEAYLTDRPGWQFLV
jgi:hypothetical protein